MIEVRNLKKHYTITEKKGLFKRETRTVNAVNGVNLNIEKGKITGLIGINGAGKTTIIKTLSTIISSDEGSITVDGLDINKNEELIKSQINIITSGDRGLYWQLTAKENLTYFGQLYGIKKDELSKRVDDLIKFVGLEEKADEPIERFSKGMKQRLQIARGLINNPEYLFMDEPTVGLDLNIAKILRNKVKELAKEKDKGILLTTHYISEIEELCDYVYVLNKGRIIYEGTTNQIIQSIGRGNLKYVIEMVEYSEELKKELGVFLQENNSTIDVELNGKKSVAKINSPKNITKEVFNLISKFTDIVSFSTVEPSLEEAILKFMESNNDD